jgi:hypothetical protein
MTNANLRPSTYADNLLINHRFYTKLATDYLNTANPDPDYLLKLLGTAAEWQQKMDEYMAHLAVTNTSYHLA